MKNKKSPFFIAAVIFLSGFVLFMINRDIFRFTYDTRCGRTFFPDTDERQDYIINGPVTLKPGSYVLSPKLSVQGNNNGIFLIDGSDEIFFYADLPDGTADPSIPFEIKDHARQVRVGIRYLGEGSTVQVTWITITADHVLYKQSVLRHLAVSFLVILIAVWLVMRFCYSEILWKLLPVFSRPENEMALVLLIVLTAAACYPVLSGKVYIHGDDMFFHVTRIRGMADSLQAGYFPVRDQLYWLNNYGYGVGFFYPDVFLYFPAVLVLLGFNLMTAYNIFLVVSSFFSIAAMWYSGYRISNNRTAAAAAAIFMAFAAYRLINIYYRAAVGEVQAAAFFPLVILGLYEIFFRDKRKWPVFAAGFLGIACCHLISLAMAAVLTAIFILTQIRRLLQDKEIFIALLKSVLVVAAISASFWLPMLEQNFTNPGLRVNNLLVDNEYLNPINYAFPAENIIVRFKAWDWIWQAGSVYPGWTMLLVPLLGIAVWKNRDDLIRAADFMVIFSVPVVWMATRSFPWQWKIFLPFVARIQFAYRLLLPATVMLCLSGGIYVSALLKNRKTYLWLAVLALFCFFSTAYPILQESAENRAVEKRLFIMQDNRVSGEEYLPHGLNKDFPGKNADTVRLTGQDIPLTIKAHKRQKLGFRFTYEVPENSGEVYFSVPLIYYTGFRGTLTSEDGTVINSEIGWDNQGLVSLSNQGISHGSVSVSYQKTLPQRIGEGITIISLIIIVMMYHRKQTITNADGQKYV